MIDGIDNLGKGQRKVFYRLIIQVVQAFKENGNGAIRFICLSQPILEKEISGAFASHFQMPSIMITKEKNLRDIETYVSWAIDQSTKLKRALKDKTFRQGAVAELARCTGGVFESKQSLKNITLKILTAHSGCFTIEATGTERSCRFVLGST